MKRIAMVMALVVMAAGACKKAQQSNAAPPAENRMADSMKMAPGDTTHMMMGDTSKAHMAAPAPAPATKAPATKAPATKAPATKAPAHRP